MVMPVSFLRIVVCANILVVTSIVYTGTTCVYCIRAHEYMHVPNVHVGVFTRIGQWICSDSERCC